MLHDFDRDRIKVLPPFLLNHQIVLISTTGESSDRLRSLCEAIKAKVLEKSFKIKGQDIQVVMEMSPDRKRKCKNVFSAMDQIRNVGISESKFQLQSEPAGA